MAELDLGKVVMDDYNDLKNKPKINGVELSGELTTEDLNLNPGGGGGASDYEALENKPQIGGVELSGDVSLEELGIQPKGEYLTAGSIVSFSQASERVNIEATDNVKGIFGKVKKWFADLKAVAFSGSYNDLSDKPTIPAKTSQLTNDSGYVTTGNYIGDFVRNASSDGGHSDSIDPLFRDAGMSLELSFQENMNLLKKIGIKANTATIGIVNNSNLSTFNMSLPISSGGHLFVQYPKYNRRVFTLYNFRNGDCYINTELDGTYGEWRLMNPTITNNLLATVAGTTLDAVQGKTLNGKIDRQRVSRWSGSSFATLEEFAERMASATDLNFPQMGLFKDTGGWTPNGTGWYHFIITAQNEYTSGQQWATGLRGFFFDGSQNLWAVFITGSKDTGLTVNFKKLSGEETSQIVLSAGVTTLHTNKIYKNNNTCHCELRIVLSGEVTQWGYIGTIPEGFRPKSAQGYIFAVGFNGATPILMQLHNSGIVQVGSACAIGSDIRLYTSYLVN